jgi:hypothetical protein
MGESAHKITKLITLIKRRLKVFMNEVDYNKVKRFTMKETTKNGKGMTTIKNGLGVELDLKNSKARLSEIEVVVHVNKVTHP